MLKPLKPSMALGALLLVPHAFAQTNITTLAEVPGQIYGGILIGPDGAIYGPTVYGGAYSRGSVFRLNPPSSLGEAWTLTTLHSFDYLDGEAPQTALVMGSAGALYGTANGGAYQEGVAFSLTPPQPHGGSWDERVLYSFTGQGGDGALPQSGLAFGPDGKLYGAAGNGGAYGAGTVFELTPPASGGGAWTESVIYSFGSDPADGGYPTQGALLVDKAGNLYGATGGNGYSTPGAAYMLLRPTSPSSKWVETVLYSFTPYFGPTGALAADGSGNLYGVTPFGGAGSCQSGCGTVFELTPSPAAGAAWTERVLYSFTDQNGDGYYPNGGVIVGKDGTVYGTTAYGGSTTLGTVFWLTRPADSGGVWAETVLQTTADPFARMSFGNGVVYGAGVDSIFELKPSAGTLLIFPTGSTHADYAGLIR